VAVLIVVLSIGLAATGILVVLLIALIRHLKLLSGSLRRFQEEVRPLLQDLSAGSARASRRLSELQGGAAAGPNRQSSLGSGARIRR
jgi:hypothetical protein